METTIVCIGILAKKMETTIEYIGILESETSIIGYSTCSLKPYMERLGGELVPSTGPCARSSDGSLMITARLVCTHLCRGWFRV